MSKILVTGGLGVLGSKLVVELRLRGHDVWIVDLPHNHEEKYIRCDIGYFREIEGVFNNHNFDYVYNLAAEFGRWNGEAIYERLWHSNAVGTKNMIMLQERHGFKMIHFSSSEVYGDYDGTMVEEAMDVVPIKQMNDYAMTKWVNEMQILNSQTMKNTQTIRVRIFNTYGPGEYYSPFRSVICMFCYRALHNIPYTVYKNHYRTSTYIYDCTQLVSNIIDNFKSGEVYNISSNNYHDVKAASDIILNYLKKDDRFVTYEESEPLTTRVKKADAQKAYRDLGYSPKVSIEEGIPNTIEWMKDVYNVK